MIYHLEKRAAVASELNVSDLAQEQRLTEPPFECADLMTASFQTAAPFLIELTV